MNSRITIVRAPPSSTRTTNYIKVRIRVDCMLAHFGLATRALSSRKLGWAAGARIRASLKAP
jgi:hypothetical protein